MRRAFQRHRPADMQIGGVDVGAGEAQRLEHVEVRRVQRLGIELQHAVAKLGAQRPLLNTKRMSKADSSAPSRR